MPTWRQLKCVQLQRLAALRLLFEFVERYPFLPTVNQFSGHGTGVVTSKLSHWRAVQAVYPRKTAPNGDLRYWTLEFAIEFMVNVITATAPRQNIPPPIAVSLHLIGTEKR